MMRPSAGTLTIRLLMVRHAIAEEKETWAPRNDELRPLTPKGVRRMRQAARGLNMLFPEVDRIASSSLTRAQETAQILATQYKKKSFELFSSLHPSAPHEDFMSELLSTCKAEQDSVTIVCVGHEPHLGSLVGWLLGIQEPLFQFKKGGVCVLNLSLSRDTIQQKDFISPNETVLEALWPPAYLRRIGKEK